MKRTLMMMLFVALATVASVQAADVKINLLNRGANQQMTAAQNVKYSISNAAGEIVAQGENANIKVDLPEGNYEITVEQTTPNDQVRYGAHQFKVTSEGANVSYEIMPNGLRLIGQPGQAGQVAPTLPRVLPQNPVAPNYPVLPPQAPYAGGMGAMGAGGNWGMLAMTGALVATAIALGVDDNGVTAVQR